MYCVIMGDIIRSKELPAETRETDTAVMEEILEQINADYRESILASFGIVRGDAFEGVLYSQQYAPRIIRRIIRSFYEKRGLKVRISAAMNTLSTVSTERNKADGPAFHIAVRELEELKAQKSDHWFQVSMVTGTLAQPLVDSLLSLLCAMTKGWTENQRKTVWAMAEIGGQQKLVSQQLGIAPSVVSKQLKAANYDAYHSAWENLEKYLIEAEEAALQPVQAAPSYTTYYSIAQRKLAQRKFLEAVSHFEKALSLAKEELERHDLLVPIYNQLAWAQIEAACREAADTEKEPLLARAYEVIEAALALQKAETSQRQDYLQTLNCLGRYHFAKCDYDKALSCCQKARQLAEKLYEPESPHLRDIINNTAVTLAAQNFHEEALALFLELLPQAEEYADSDPMTYATILANIGLCLARAERYQEAQSAIQEALVVSSAILPPKHEYILRQKGLLDSIRSKL